MRVLALPALVLVLAGCGDPIEVGNASDKRAVAEDRKLADLAQEIVGTWRGTVGFKEPAPSALTITVQLTLTRDAATVLGSPRTGQFTTECISPTCDLPLDAQRDLQDVFQVEDMGTYQVVSDPGAGRVTVYLDGRGETAQALTISEDGEKLVMVLPLPIFEPQQLEFTRAP